DTYDIWAFHQTVSNLITAIPKEPKNLQIAVEAAGVKLNDVVSLRIYVVGDQSSQIGSVREVLREFFSGEKPPTSTWLGVASLAVKDFGSPVFPVAPPRYCGRLLIVSHDCLCRF